MLTFSIYHTHIPPNPDKSLKNDFHLLNFFVSKVLMINVKWVCLPISFISLSDILWVFFLFFFINIISSFLFCVIFFSVETKFLQYRLIFLGHVSIHKNIKLLKYFRPAKQHINLTLYRAKNENLRSSIIKLITTL